MADRLPAVSGKRVVRALLKAGFAVDRIVGSHHLLVRPGDEGRAVTVPVHANRDLSAGTLRSIVQQAGMTVEEFRDFL
jgi:predicted RNA binding protein YcfA (HicA-like mRNA interferase family)